MLKDLETGREIKIGDVVKNRNGETVSINDIHKPTKQKPTGLVEAIKKNGVIVSYMPMVVGAKYE